MNKEKAQILVSPIENGWKVHREGSNNAIINTRTKAEAEIIAKKIEKNGAIKEKVQTKNGNSKTNDYIERISSSKEKNSVFKRLSSR